MRTIIAAVVVVGIALGILSGQTKSRKKGGGSPPPAQEKKSVSCVDAAQITFETQNEDKDDDTKVWAALLHNFDDGNTEMGRTEVLTGHFNDHTEEGGHARLVLCELLLPLGASSLDPIQTQIE